MAAKRSSFISWPRAALTMLVPIAFLACYDSPAKVWITVCVFNACLILCLNLWFAKNPPKGR
jgi:hypothetical protein